jgi:hypothetical protein
MLYGSNGASKTEKDQDDEGECGVSCGTWGRQGWGTLGCYKSEQGQWLFYFILLFIYLHVHTLFGSLLPPVPLPHPLLTFALNVVGSHQKVLGRAGKVEKDCIDCWVEKALLWGKNGIRKTVGNVCSISRGYDGELDASVSNGGCSLRWGTGLCFGDRILNTCQWIHVRSKGKRWMNVNFGILGSLK